MVKDICLAEDIMQETFVKLAVKKPRFDGRSSFPTWLYSVARNCAIDRLRKKARHKEIPLDECFEVSDETDIEKLYIREEQKIELHRAMSKLPPDYAQVLYLRYFEDFDTKAAARIMRKSERQIGDLLYRAKKSLKTELERAGFTYED
ncbi:MAG: RNA polymerase sigma factor [Ruminiclostridium sp.]|nr:RNA polymerase sigma factor [Ruminiclostridium sp.]